MTIKQKSILAAIFVLVVSILSIVRFIVPLQRTLMEELVVNTTNSFVQKQLDFLVSMINSRIEYVVAHTYMLADDPLIAKSNEEFDKMSQVDIQEKLDYGDSIWENPEESMVSDVLNNPLSETLKMHFNAMGFYKQKYGHEIFTEVFITNKYGATLATTNKTSDYNQADEEWWINAKQKDIYIENIVYDESSKTYSIVVGSSLKDTNGNFVGAVKAVLTVEDIIDLAVMYNKPTDTYQNIDLLLLTKNLQIIYPQEKSSDPYIQYFVTKYGSTFEKDTILKNELIKDTCLNDPEKNCIFNYATMAEVNNLKWILVISRYEDVTNIAINKAKNISFVTFSILSLGTIILFSFLMLSITKQLFKITDTINKVSSGDFTAKVEISTKDELGMVATKFNNMLDIITKSKIFEETILQHIEYAIIIINMDRKILFINNAAIKLLQFSQDTNEILNTNYDDLIEFYKESDGKINNTFIENTLSGKSKMEAVNIELLTKKNKKVPVECTASTIRDKQNNPLGSVIIIRDITEYRRIGRAKSEFVSIASHQLRTPLASIRWYAEALSKGMGKIDKPTKSQKEYLQVIYDSTLRIINLVNSLLNVSRLEVGTFKISPEEILLHKVMSEMIQSLAPKIKEKKLKIITECDPKVPPVMLDKDIMGIIFQNILTNAVKYTLKGGTITIKGQYIVGDVLLKKLVNYKGNTGILISITDTGLGIPEGQQKDIFTKLFRADNIKKVAESGTGLGLYTTKLIMDNIGGAVWFDSEENKGSTFYLLLPETGMEKKDSSKKLEFSE